MSSGVQDILENQNVFLECTCWNTFVHIFHAMCCLGDTEWQRDFQWLRYEHEFVSQKTDETNDGH